MDIHFNILMVVLMLFAMGFILHGNRVGFTGEIKNMLTWIVGVVVLVMLFFLYGAIKENNHLRIIISVIVLIIASMIYRMVKFLLAPIEMIVDMPVIQTVDRFLGLILGLMETVLLVWMLSSLLSTFELGRFGDWMRSQVNESSILTFLFNYNYVGMIMPAISRLVEGIIESRAAG